MAILNMRAFIAGLAGFAVFSALAAGPALAQSEGLVLAADGPMRPRLAVHDEIARGMEVLIGEKTVLTFLHYDSCTIATVRGGELSLSGRRYILRGGRIVDEDRTECPKRVAARHGEGEPVAEEFLPRSGLRPVFILNTTAMEDFDRAWINQGGTRLDLVRDGAAALTLPSDAPALQREAPYRLMLEFSDGAMREAAFMAGRSAEANRFMRVFPE